MLVNSRTFISWFYTLYNQQQIGPFDGHCMARFVVAWQLKSARVQLLVIDHHTGIFHVKDLHDGLLPVNENKYLTAADIAVHLGVHNTTQGIKALAHVNRVGIQVIR